MSKHPATTLLVPRRRAVAAGLVIALALITYPARAQAELELIDGRVLAGTSVRREDGQYILKLESGEEVAFPAELVKTVRRAESRTIGGSPPPEGPSGIRSGAPRQLAGESVGAPRTSDQLEVLGEPSKFRKNVVESDWKPSTDWDMDPERQNDWAPSTWAEDVVDHSWEPESAWSAGNDVMASRRSTWQKSAIDSSWTPTDGFKK